VIKGWYSAATYLTPKKGKCKIVIPHNLSRFEVRICWQLLCNRLA